MGLDMYAYAINRKPELPVDFEANDGTEIHYWRKHPNLHGWMERLYRRKGGIDSAFNCVNVQLASEDLDALEVAIKAGMLPVTNGFFFGESDGREIEDDLRFVSKARCALQEGKSIFYTSWW